MRRPHKDDLSRIEQTLRDLERGAFVACASYNAQTIPSADKNNDAVTVGWLREEHPTAKLIEHASRQYNTQLLLRASRRPWVMWPDSLANAAGTLWHVRFSMQNRRVDVSDLWNARSFAIVRSLAVHLVADDPTQISLTFAAADDDQAIADAIGDALETLLTVSRYGRPEEGEELQWQRRAIGADYRIINATGWNIVDETTIPISMFWR